MSATDKHLRTASERNARAAELGFESPDYRAYTIGDAIGLRRTPDHEHDTPQLGIDSPAGFPIEGTEPTDACDGCVFVYGEGHVEVPCKHQRAAAAREAPAVDPVEQARREYEAATTLSEELAKEAAEAHDAETKAYWRWAKTREAAEKAAGGGK